MNGATIRITVNGQPVDVEAGCSVAAAVARLGTPFRRSVRGEPRMPLCGMGACFECRVCIDGVAEQRACMVTVRAGMQVTTDD
ncbi:MAG: (2Fe-2S)-binding protein [Xanthomonadaceae bacterium]|nr:(2Fe-2S)-binding protein [Xanthomonadaceae bacterium]MDE2315199.1 (2Fe-2S)-binding protein [Xanthomonadaceae bacterium]